MNHKFEVGSLVRLTTPVSRAVDREYKIVGQLPIEGNFLQYRIKSQGEPNERMVKEYQIRALHSFRDG